MGKRRIKLKIEATLSIDPIHKETIAKWNIDELRDCMFEIFVTKLDVELNRRRPMRAKLEFVTPDPYELKLV